jgi:ABC-type dipeptide/oligopeptide/nickel transport system ATPase component
VDSNLKFPEPKDLRVSNPANHEGIVIEGVSKSFGSKKVLDQCDLLIHKGETLVIVGRSGEGKSVLLKSIVRLLDIDSGNVWIEGIGSNFGILQSGSSLVVGWYTRFLCMSEDGELIYMNPNFNSCHLINTKIEEIQYSRIQVYPNPTKDKINIKNSENVKIESVSIIDLNGQKLLEFENDINELDLSGFSKGIYLLKLTYEEGEVYRKIIIE